VSLTQASWPRSLLLGALGCISACGARTGDDTEQSLETGGVAATTASGSTLINGGTLGGYVAFGGRPATGGKGVQPFGGVGMDGGNGGAFPATGGARSLGGSVSTGGRATPITGGAKATGGAGIGGVSASGGAAVLGGSKGAGGSQTIGGTRATTSLVTGGSPATGGTPASTLPAMGGSTAVGGDVCALPPSAGSCDVYTQSYYFNPFHARCEPFIYGGCGGNANRFDTLQACEQRCNQSACPIIIPPTSPIWTCPSSAACYYQDTTGCRCRAESGQCNADSTCTADDAGAPDASAELSDAGTNAEPLPVVFCSCNTEQWACRMIELLGQ
jgi:hypothetical protein